MIFASKLYIALQEEMMSKLIENKGINLLSIGYKEIRNKYLI